jgi:hypothetical protein
VRRWDPSDEDLPEAAESDDPMTTSVVRHLAAAGWSDRSTMPAVPAEHRRDVQLEERTLREPMRRALPDEPRGDLRLPAGERRQVRPESPALRAQPAPLQRGARPGRGGCW